MVYAKGLAMGAADAVPGVSGGTIALITGIYERLIQALTALHPDPVGHLVRAHRREHRRQLREDLVEMDVPFLVVLGLGMVSAVVLLARVVQVALSSIPAETFAFFFGLIGASAIALYERQWLATPGRVVSAAAGFSLAFLVAGATGRGVLDPTLLVVFATGTVAIVGLVLPGISGAFILLLLGQYDYLTATLNSFVDEVFLLVTGSGTDRLAAEATVVLTFVAGGLVGLLTIAHAVRFALERYRGATLAFLVSLMVGALRFPALRILEHTESTSPGTLGVIVLAAIVGAALVLLLDRYTDDLDYSAAD